MGNNNADVEKKSNVFSVIYFLKRFNIIRYVLCKLIQPLFFATCK